MSLLDAIRQARQGIDAREQPLRQQMVDLYEGVIAAVERDLESIGIQITNARAQGIDVSPDWLRRQARYTQLLWDAEREYSRFATEAEMILQNGKIAAIRGGAADAWEMMGQSGLTLDMAGGRINTLAVMDATAATVAAPVARSLARYGTEGSKVIRDTLLDGVARGRSPRSMIRDIRRQLHAPVNTARLEAIVRTETMRAYRSSMNQQYARMGHLIEGYRWTCSHSRRTCLACLARDGEISRKPWDQMHVSCRCVSTPVPIGSTYRYTNGEQWLQQQPDAVQRRMMPSEEAYLAWKRGDITLSDFVGVHHDRTWGDAVYQRSGRQVLAGVR